MRPFPPRRRSARAVCDRRIEELTARGEELAKGWLIALVEQAPLDEAQALLPSGGDFAREAPGLCEAFVRALMDDAGLRELEPSVARAGELTGARDAASAVRSVDALQAVLWSALRAALGDADGELVAAVAERLALVGEVVRAAALRPFTQPWPVLLDEEVGRSKRSGARLSLLLVELQDVDRLRAASPAGEAAAISDQFARAVREVTGPRDIVERDGDARVWVLAPDAGRPDASALGSRIAAAVRALPAWRGAPLGVEIGIAVLGEDGGDAAALLEAAEVAKFAAQASGVDISP